LRSSTTSSAAPADDQQRRRGHGRLARGRARSGRPPRETTAAMPAPGPAAAPQRPPRCRSCWRRNSDGAGMGCPRAGRAAPSGSPSARRPASRPIVEQRFGPGQLSSPGVSRSNQQRAPARPCSARRPHNPVCGGLCRLLPLPWAKDHDPRATLRHGQVSRPAGPTPAWGRTSWLAARRVSGGQRPRTVLAGAGGRRPPAAHLHAGDHTSSSDTWGTPGVELPDGAESLPGVLTQTSSSASAPIPVRATRAARTGTGEHPPGPPPAPGRSDRRPGPWTRLRLDA